jgi:hypothetical protein
MWLLSGVAPDDTVTVTLVVNNGINAAKAEVLTIE